MGEWIRANPTVVGTIITAIIALIGSWLVGRMSARSTAAATAQTTTVAWAKDLMARVESLEDGQRELRENIAARDKIIRAAVTFIDRVGVWVAGGMRGRKPRPGEILSEHIDVELWSDDS